MLCKVSKFHLVYTQRNITSLHVFENAAIVANNYLKAWSAIDLMSAIEGQNYARARTIIEVKDIAEHRKTSKQDVRGFLRCGVSAVA